MVSLTASVAVMSGSGAPTGTITFFDSTTSAALGTAPLALVKGKYQASFTTLLPAVTGVHTLTAVYSGDAVFGPSTSAPLAQTVYDGAQPRSTTTTLSVPLIVAAWQPITATATVTVAKGKPQPITGLVRLYLDDQLVATSALNSAGQATLATSGLPPGVHTIVAVYAGDGSAVFAGSASQPAYVLAR
jgi:hypothetical protein